MKLTFHHDGGNEHYHNENDVVVSKEEGDKIIRAQQKFSDTEPDWYDFGGGLSVAPEATNFPEKETPDAKYMAALCCVRNNTYFYKNFFAIEASEFSEQKLAELKAEFAPALLAFAERGELDERK